MKLKRGDIIFDNWKRRDGWGVVREDFDSRKSKVIKYTPCDLDMRSGNVIDARGYAEINYKDAMVFTREGYDFDNWGPMCRIGNCKCKFYNPYENAIVDFQYDKNGDVTRLN